MKNLAFLLLLFFLCVNLVTAQVVAINTPGAVCVRVDREQLQNADLPDTQLLILDRSGSMGDYTRLGEQRMEIARNVLLEYVAELPQEAEIGFRTYGASSSCDSSDLLFPIQAFNRDELVNQIEENASPSGTTPIAYALSQMPEDFMSVAGTKNVILVTDGQEACNGDPIAVAASLAQQDPQLSIDVIGFDIDDAVAQQNLRGIPLVANGNYVEVSTSQDFLQALSITYRMSFEVYQDGQLLQEGLVNRSTLGFEDGIYRVNVPKLNITDMELVVEKGRGTSLVVDADGATSIVQNDGTCIAAFCPDVPLPRMIIGLKGHVTDENPKRQRVRTQPGLDAEILRLMELGEEFTVLDGPICNDGYLWWYIKNELIEGWTAEGIPGEYYLAPETLY